MTNKAAHQMSAAERATFLEEARAHGVVETCRGYGISTKTYYQWQEQYQRGGIEALAPKHRSGKNGVSAEVLALRRENEQLKKLLAEKELGLAMKDALLKKTSLRVQNERR